MEFVPAMVEASFSERLADEARHPCGDIRETDFGPARLAAVGTFSGDSCTKHLWPIKADSKPIESRAECQAGSAEIRKEHRQAS